MANKPIYTAEQLAFVKKQYIREGLTPRQLAPLVNGQFGTSFTVEQMRYLVRDRGWTKKRAALAAKIPSTETLLAQAEQKAIAEVKEDVEAFLAQCAALGQEAVNKAQGFVRGASTAKTLASAISAARGAIGIKRQAIGLDNAAGMGSPTNIVFNFNRDPASPFAPKPVTPDPVDVEADVTDA